MKCLIRNSCIYIWIIYWVNSTAYLLCICHHALHPLLPHSVPLSHVLLDLVNTCDEDGQVVGQEGPQAFTLCSPAILPQSHVGPFPALKVVRRSRPTRIPWWWWWLPGSVELPPPPCSLRRSQGWAQSTRVVPVHICGLRVAVAKSNWMKYLKILYVYIYICITLPVPCHCHGSDGLDALDVTVQWWMCIMMNMAVQRIPYIQECFP